MARQPNQPVDTSSLDVFPFRFSDLPLEVLQYIFLCCTEPRVGGNHLNNKTSPEWLPITQVCRSWRAVAHTYPPLWATITPNLDMFWADILQQRSKPLPLDVHIRVGRRDIDDREASMTAYTALTILRHISHRMRTLRLDGSREHIQCILSTLHRASRLHSLSINVPLWDLGDPISIPENVFAFDAPVRTLSFSADRALRAPVWLLRGLTTFTTGGKVPLPPLMDALSKMHALESFTLLHCTTSWDEGNLPNTPIEMDRLEEFVVRADSPRHFALLATHLVMPETARRRLAVRTLAAPGWGFWAPWFDVFPPLYAARGGLRHVHISGGPTHGRFRTWTDGPHDDMARFCFELEWNGSPRAPDGVRAIELTSPFYRLHTLCNELKAAGVERVVVEGDPEHIAVQEGYWHQLLARLPAVEELWLHPGTAEVLQSACAPQDGAERVLRSLKRVYVVEGKLSAPKQPAAATGSRSSLHGPSAQVEGYTLRSRLPASPASRAMVVRARYLEKKTKEAYGLDMTPGLMALLGDDAAPLREVHLRNCEVEDGSLAPLIVLAKVRKNSDWVIMDI